MHFSHKNSRLILTKSICKQEKHNQLWHFKITRSPFRLSFAFQKVKSLLFKPSEFLSFFSPSSVKSDSSDESLSSSNNYFYWHISSLPLWQGRHCSCDSIGRHRHLVGGLPRLDQKKHRTYRGDMRVDRRECQIDSNRAKTRHSQRHLIRQSSPNQRRWFEVFNYFILLICTHWE